MRQMSRKIVVFAGMLGIAASSVACKPTASTNGSSNPGNRGRTADAQYTSITGVGGTSTTSAQVNVTLLSKGGAPIIGIVPTFTVSTLTANDFNFYCPATDAYGKAACSFRSFDTATKTLLLTSPVAVTGGTLAFTQAGSQLSLVTSTQPTTSVGGSSLATAPKINILDPLSAIVTGDNSTVVTVALNTVSNTNVLGVSPTLKMAGVACSPCTATAVNGVVDFGLAANLLSVNTSGTYTLTFTSTGKTSVTSEQFSVTNNGATQLLFTQQPPTSIAPLQTFTRQPIISVADATGNLVTTGGCESATVLLTKATPATGTLLGTVTKNAVAGKADYSAAALRIDAVSAGSTYTLTASKVAVGGCASALTSATSNAFTVTAVGIPYKLYFSTQPSLQTTTGVTLPVQPVVQVLDASGNLVTSNNTLQVTLDTDLCGGLVTVAGTNVRTVANGVATFNDIVLNSAVTANCVLQATSSVAGVLNATSENVQVNLAGVVGLNVAFISQPRTTGKNSAILGCPAPAAVCPLQVAVQDGAGHLVTGDYTTTITITKTPTTGNFTSTSTTNATVVGGIATFSNLAIDTPGAYTLVASAAALTSGSSNSFVVNTDGTPSNLQFSCQPVTQTAGTAFNATGTNTINCAGKPMPVVDVKDDSGNLLTTSGIPVTLSCSNPTSGCSLTGLPLTVYSSNGRADFNITGASLAITTPTGNNIALTAHTTSTTYTIADGVTPSPMIINPATGSNSQSAVGVTCPSAINKGDGTAFVFVKDTYGNAFQGSSVVLTYTPSAGTCTGSCGSTDTTGKASCAFACDTLGSVSVSVTQIDGGASFITKTAACAF